MSTPCWHVIYINSLSVCVFSLPELALRTGRVRSMAVPPCLLWLRACSNRLVLLCLPVSPCVSGVCVRVPSPLPNPVLPSPPPPPLAIKLSLPAGAHQAGWGNGASWKILATRAPVPAGEFARAPWWRALPASPADAPVASEVRRGEAHPPRQAKHVLPPAACAHTRILSLSRPRLLPARPLSQQPLHPWCALLRGVRWSLRLLLPAGLPRPQLPE